MEYLIEIERHHSVEEAPTIRMIAEIKGDPKAAALKLAFEHYMQELGLEAPSIDWDKTVADGGTVVTIHDSDCGLAPNNPEYHDYDFTFAIWCEPDGERWNMGFGICNHRDANLSIQQATQLTLKQDNRWVIIKPFKIDMERFNTLLERDKSNLVEIILKAEAIAGKELT